LILFHAVLDTNVIVSAFLSSNELDSAPAQVVKHALAGRIEPIFNEEILIEYRDVLFRKKFGFDHETVKILIEELTRRGQLIKPLSSGESFSDPDDAIFYETMLATASTANCFLVTGNLRHFPKNPLVLTPRLMVALLEKTEIL